MKVDCSCPEPLSFLLVPFGLGSGPIPRHHYCYCSFSKAKLLGIIIVNPIVPKSILVLGHVIMMIVFSLQEQSL